MQVDSGAERIYWQGNDISFERKMWVVDYNGTNLQELFPSGGAAAVALDLTARKLYWTDGDNGKIYVVTNPGALDLPVPAVTPAGTIALVLLVLTTATALLLRRRISSSKRG